MESLADLRPLRRVLVPGPFSPIGGGKRIIYLLERALEVEDVFGVASKNVRLHGGSISAWCRTKKKAELN
jgi:hypothetical protein